MQELADSVFGNDYLDTDLQPILDFAGKPIIAPESLGEAALELFLAMVIQQLRRPDKLPDATLAAMRARFADFERYGVANAGARAEFARLAAVVHKIAKPDGRWPNPALGELANSDERIAALILMAAKPDLTVDEQRQCYAQAVAIAERNSEERGAFQTYFVRAQLARLDATHGFYERSFEGLCESLTVALQSQATVVQVSELLLQTGDLGYALGRWQVVERFAEQAQHLPFPAHEEATGWLIRLALDRFDYARAERLAQDFRTEIEPAGLEFAADVCAATFRFAEAEQNYAGAQTGYLNLQYAGAASQVALKQARFALDVLGAPGRAAQILDSLAGSRSFPEPLIELELNLLRIRQFGRTGSMAMARDQLDRTLALLDRVPRLPRTYAMVAVATLLAEGGGNQADAVRLSEMMGSAPLSCRVVALQPFALAAPDARLAAEIGLPEPTLDMAVQDRLHIAAAMIFFGRERSAAALLQSIIGGGQSPTVIAAAMRVAMRIAPAAIVPPNNWIDTWSANAQQQPRLAGIVLLEEADRLFVTGAIAAARRALALAKSNLGDLPPYSKWSELLARLEASTAAGGGTVGSLDAEIATLDPERLLRQATVLTVGVNPSGVVELRSSVSPPRGEPLFRRELAGELMHALTASSLENDLYPSECAEVLNKGRDTGENVIGLLWRKLTGLAWVSVGTTSLRRQIAELLEGATGKRVALGYAWHRGWLAPVRRGLSRSKSERSLRRILAAVFAPKAASPNSIIAFEAQTLAAASIPWELGHSGAQPFFRTQRGVTLPDTLLHLRRALAMLRDAGDFTASDWDGFIAALGGPARFRITVRERMKPNLPRRVLILRSDGESQRRRKVSYGASGFRLEDVYNRAGFEVTTMPLDTKSVLSRLDKKSPPGLIHVSAPISESFSPREAFLESELEGPMRPELLTQILLWRDDGFMRPLLVLDVAENRYDPGRTLLLRNAFAARLYAQASRGVLAIGPSPADLLQPAAGLLTDLLRRETIGLADLHNEFWAGMSHPVAPALFSLDPDLPVWD